MCTSLKPLPGANDGGQQVLRLSVVQPQPAELERHTPKWAVRRSCLRAAPPHSRAAPRAPVQGRSLLPPTVHQTNRGLVVAAIGVKHCILRERDPAAGLERPAAALPPEPRTECRKPSAFRFALSGFAEHSPVVVLLQIRVAVVQSRSGAQVDAILLALAEPQPRGAGAPRRGREALQVAPQRRAGRDGQAMPMGRASYSSLPQTFSRG